MSPNRRDTLHLLASAGLVGLAGCLDQTGGAQTSTTTDSNTDTETTSTATKEPTTAQPTDSTTTEQVRIENRTETSRVVSVEVLEDDETIIAGTYEVPASTGLRIDHAFEWARYTVRGTADGGDWHTMEWEPSSCASTPAPNGDMDAGVVVTQDGVEVVHNTCDFLKLGTVYIDSYEPAAEFEVSD